jgi:hypothetical protein
MRIIPNKKNWLLNLVSLAIILLASVRIIDANANTQQAQAAEATKKQNNATERQNKAAAEAAKKKKDAEAARKLLPPPTSSLFENCINNSIITIQNVAANKYLNVDASGLINVDGTDSNSASSRFKVVRPDPQSNLISLQSISNGRLVQARNQGDWTIDTANLSNPNGPLFYFEQESIVNPAGYAPGTSLVYTIKSKNTEGYLNYRGGKELRTHSSNSANNPATTKDNYTRFLVKVIGFTGDSIDQCTNNSIIAIRNDNSGKYLNVDTAGKVNLDGTDGKAKSSQFKVIRSGSNFKLQSELNGRFVQARDTGDWTVDTALLDNPNGPLFYFQEHANSSDNTPPGYTMYHILSRNTLGYLNWRDGSNLRTHGGPLPSGSTGGDISITSLAAPLSDSTTKFIIEIISQAAQGPTEMLNTLPTAGQKVAIKNVGSGKYLQVGGYPDELDNKDWLYSWGANISKQEAQFIIDVRNPDAMNPKAPLDKYFGFRSVANGKYVEAVPQGGNPGFVIRTNRQDFGTNIWDSFTIEQNENDTTGKTFRIKSNAENGGYLNWRGRGHLRTHGDDSKTATTENTIPNNILFTFEVIP